MEDRVDRGRGNSNGWSVCLRLFTTEKLATKPSKPAHCQDSLKTHTPSPGPTHMAKCDCVHPEANTLMSSVRWSHPVALVAGTLWTLLPPNSLCIQLLLDNRDCFSSACMENCVYVCVWVLVHMCLCAQTCVQMTLQPAVLSQRQSVSMQLGPRQHAWDRVRTESANERNYDCGRILNHVLSPCRRWWKIPVHASACKWISAYLFCVRTFYLQAALFFWLSALQRATVE